MPRGLILLLLTLLALSMSGAGTPALARTALAGSASPRLPLTSAAGAGLVPQPSAPSNPWAGSALARVLVTQTGLQRITGADLAAAGIATGTLSPALLHLYQGAVEVALEELGTGDGLLGPDDSLHFYAAQLGDRWNAQETYWLTSEQTPGLRMATRPTDGTAPARASALERGDWASPAIYDSLLPGADGDHWFSADLRSGPGLPPDTLALALDGRLPAAPGSTTLTLTLSAYTTGQHSLEASIDQQQAQQNWSGAGDITPSFTIGSTGLSLTLALLPGATPAGVEVDSLRWERPAQLLFGGNGAIFHGVAGEWRYQLGQLPGAGWRLYDISSQQSPQLLASGSQSTAEFVDSGARSYLLSGPGLLHTPSIRRHQPVDLATPLNLEALYIAPAQFLPALGPLLAERAERGYSAAGVDVQNIYDSWSFGQVSPEAIRAFLRYAYASWATPPLAVTLVGDATSDPLNYTGRNNINFIPPYLAMVDPWIGETACETCYVQLDGASPLDATGAGSLPELPIGRLPVKSVAELSQLVGKLVDYERAAAGESWRARSLFVADNYREENGQTDPAGDFALFAEQSVALQPEGMRTERLYYDPLAGQASPPWREPGAANARARTLQLLGKGAGLVTYTGHSHQYQWAVTEEGGALLGLYDVDQLGNSGQPVILLEMTCLTSAFQTPAFSGTTIDERFLLKPSGGAIAVWGPTGAGVSYGHAALQRGFHRALWSAPRMQATIGELTLAGHQELYAQNSCCQEAMRTYALLGDPLTRARVAPTRSLYLPLARSK